jgi:DNA-binding NarL/FixJ family response regulator
MSEAQPVIVLLVGADAETLASVEAALARECALLVARGLDAAQKLAWSRRPAVVVVDDEVKEQTPAAVVDAIRAIAPGVRAVVLTSARDPEYLKALAGLGPVVSKPFEAERIQAAVRSMARLAAMATGVDKMRTGQFPSEPPESRRRTTSRR